MCRDIAMLALCFIFSPIPQLRFDKCKNILERLEELERTVRESLQARSTSQDPSPIPLVVSFNIEHSVGYSIETTKASKGSTETHETLASNSRKPSIFSKYNSFQYIKGITTESLSRRVSMFHNENIDTEERFFLRY